MRASPHCKRSETIDVYLNGKHVKDVFYADEEAGEVWASYRGADGRLVPEIVAEPGAFIHEGLQVIRLRGRVEIRITAREGESVEDVRRIVNDSSTPFYPYRILTTELVNGFCCLSCGFDSAIKITLPSVTKDVAYQCAKCDCPFLEKL